MPDVVPVAVCPPLEVTVYWVIVEPPLNGILNIIVACQFPGNALTVVGASGRVTGVKYPLGAEAILVPTTLVAVTVKVYCVPLVRPVTMIHEPVPIANCHSLEVTV